MISIYLVTNQKNGKRYVGQTTNTRLRWSSHRSRGRFHGAAALHVAIREDGVESFSFRVIERCDTKERALNLEERWIRLCNSAADGGHGYNMTRGGLGPRGIIVSAKTRAMRSTKVVQMTRDGVEVARYPSMTAAARAMGSTKSMISHCCEPLSRNKTHRGFIWQKAG